MLNRPAQLNCILQNIVQLCLRRGSSKATKFYCDFKFRSATFNEGYVGGDIIVGMTKTPGYEVFNMSRHFIQSEKNDTRTIFEFHQTHSKQLETKWKANSDGTRD